MKGGLERSILRKRTEWEKRMRNRKISPSSYTTSGSADVVSDIDEGMYGYLDMGLVVLRQRWTQGARYGGLLSLGVGGFLTR